MLNNLTPNRSTQNSTDQKPESGPTRTFNLAGVRANLKGLIFKKDPISVDSFQESTQNNGVVLERTGSQEFGRLEDLNANESKEFEDMEFKVINSCPNLDSVQKRVIIKPSSLVFDKPSEENKNMKFDKINNLGDDIYEIFGNFKNFYQECEKLGQGVSAIVKRCVSKDTKEEFAVKVVNSNGDEELEMLIKNEFVNRRSIAHKNIVKVHKLYIDRVKNKIYTIMELVKGKEMLDSVCIDGHYSETVASNFFKQLLLAIQFLHKHGVVHRDIKPQNILISDENQILKLTDFNVSKFHEKGEKGAYEYSAFSKENIKMWTYTGTVSFLAPEVLEDLEYTEAVDMWSCGLVLYMMLCGKHPFQADELDDLIEEIKVAKINYDDEAWEAVSPEAKDLVSRLLQKDFTKRFSPFDALSHPWIISNGDSSKVAIPDMAKNFRYNYLANRQMELSRPPQTELISMRKLERGKMSPMKLNLYSLAIKKEGSVGLPQNHRF